MSNLRKDFGKRIRALRIKANLTQEQLAELANISVDFLSMVERGINAPSFDTLEKIANALHVPVRELFLFENDDSI
jgi:transcriptional regulator with XRE-family HTH domain